VLFDLWHTGLGSTGSAVLARNDMPLGNSGVPLCQQRASNHGPLAVGRRNQLANSRCRNQRGQQAGGRRAAGRWTAGGQAGGQARGQAYLLQHTDRISRDAAQGGAGVGSRMASVRVSKSKGVFMRLGWAGMCMWGWEGSHLQVPALAG